MATTACSPKVVRTSCLPCQAAARRDIAFPDTDDDLGDPRTWMHRVAAILTDPLQGSIIRGRPRPDADVHERIYLPTRTQTIARIQRAQNSGRLPALAPEILADPLRLLLAWVPDHRSR